ncbi:hypothetical protein NPIL_338291 [Nephila pilipes]|uniref:Uncharacterized protein n=1 Tax=Nephila pilipes TaxID=299642 RepID=A0A8X6U8F4_NEPPI|nr:hypothetical protein NPIL_338291 [Nephila pilipes]
MAANTLFRKTLSRKIKSNTSVSFQSAFIRRHKERDSKWRQFFRECKISPRDFERRFKSFEKVQMKREGGVRMSKSRLIVLPHLNLKDRAVEREVLEIRVNFGICRALYDSKSYIFVI